MPREEVEECGRRGGEINEDAVGGGLGRVNVGMGMARQQPWMVSTQQIALSVIQCF